MKGLTSLFVGAAATLALAVSGTVSSADRARVLTAPTGSIVHTTGSAIASVVSQNTDMTVLAAPMAGPQVFVPQINNGQAEFTLLNAADAHAALRGGEGYQAPNKNLRLVAVGFTNEIGVLVSEESGIRTAEDFKGKRVTGVFSAHKTCKALSDGVLANLGLTWDDVEVVPVTHSKTAVAALGDGRVDAALCAALGQGVIQEINARTPVRFISLNADPEAVKRTLEKFPAGRINTHKAGTKTGLAEDANLWSYPFYLLAGKDVSDEVVYNTVKAISENIDDLRNISGVFNRWIPENMVDADITIPVHPGAQRFYDEQGMWKDAVQGAHDRNMQAAQ
jgi:uncharacterized protein